jgi:hypothetical protein
VIDHFSLAESREHRSQQFAESQLNRSEPYGSVPIRLMWPSSIFQIVLLPSVPI